LNLARFWAKVQLVQFAFDFVGVAETATTTIDSG
jgi:hypothetical protein